MTSARREANSNENNFKNRFLELYIQATLGHSKDHSRFSRSTRSRKKIDSSLRSQRPSMQTRMHYHAASRCSCPLSVTLRQVAFGIYMTEPLRQLRAQCYP